MGEEKREKDQVFYYPPPYYPNEDEIDLYELWLTLWKRRRFITLFVFVSVLVATSYAFLATKLYKSKVTLAPVEKGEPSIPPSLIGIATGLGLGGFLGGGSSSTQIMSLLKSDFLKKILIERYDLLPIIFYKDWDNSTGKWKTDEPPTIYDGIRALSEIFSVSQDKKLGTIEVSCVFPYPEKAAWLLDILIKTLRDVLVKDAIETAEKNIELLNKELEKTSDPLLRKKLYELVAKNVELKVTAKVSQNFVFKVVDPPMVPDKKYKPKRALIVAVSFVSSLFMAIFLAFFLEYIEGVRKKKKEEAPEATS